LLPPTLFAWPLRLNEGGAVNSSISDTLFFTYFYTPFEDISELTVSFFGGGFGISFSGSSS